MKKHIILGLTALLTLTAEITLAEYPATNVSANQYLSYKDENEHDLYELRVFRDIPKAELKKLLSEPDKNGIREVYDFKKLKNYIEHIKIKDPDYETLLTTGTVKKLFEVENIQDRWNNNSKVILDMSVLYWEAMVGYGEPDDKNPVRAAFLKVGGTWYLIGGDLCRIEDTEPIVTSGHDESSALFVTTQHGSGGIQSKEICSVDFKFEGKNTLPSISGISHYDKSDK